MNRTPRNGWIPVEFIIRLVSCGSLFFRQHWWLGYKTHVNDCWFSMLADPFNTYLFVVVLFLSSYSSSRKAIREPIRARILHVLHLVFPPLISDKLPRYGTFNRVQPRTVAQSTQTLISGNQSFYVPQWLKLCNHTRNSHSRAASFPSNWQISYPTFLLFSS